MPATRSRAATRQLSCSTEADVQQTILRVAEWLGITLVVTDAGASLRASHGTRGGPAPPRGWPDLTGLVPSGAFRGKLIAIEVKRPGEKPTDEQRYWLKRIAAEGGLTNWFDDPAKASAWLERLLKGIL